MDVQHKNIKNALFPKKKVCNMGSERNTSKYMITFLILNGLCLAFQQVLTVLACSRCDGLKLESSSRHV